MQNLSWFHLPHENKKIIFVAMASHLVSIQNRDSVEQLARKWPTDIHVSSEEIFLCKIFYAIS